MALKAVERVWQRTGQRKYLDYLVGIVDYCVANDGTIKNFRQEEYNFDNINAGRILLTLSQQLGLNQTKYRQAAQHLHQQLREQPTTADGGYWHKEALHPPDVARWSLHGRAVCG